MQIAEVERDVQNSLRKSENAITSTETERIIQDNIGEVSESLEKKTRDSFNNIREEMGDMRARLERLADRERVDHFDARLGRAEERLDTSERNMRERIGTAEETLQDMQKRIVEDSSCTEALEQRLRAIQEQHEQAQSAHSKELATVNEALRLQWDESMKGLEAAADGVGAACDRANQAIDGVYQVLL
jgi:exonuclease VII large subunit